MKRTALLIGATGLIGSELLKLLLQTSAYSKVTVWTRRAIDIEHAKLNLQIVDFDLLLTEAPPIDAMDVYCCIGTTIKKAGSQDAFRLVDYTYPLQVAQLAAHAGTKQFILISAVGASTTSRFFYSRVKGELEHELAQLPFASLHIFQPSLLLGERHERRAGEDLSKLILPPLSSLLIGKLKQYRPVQASTLANAMLQAALRDSHGRSVYRWPEIEQLAHSSLQKAR